MMKYLPLAALLVATNAVAAPKGPDVAAVKTEVTKLQAAFDKGPDGDAEAATAFDSTFWFEGAELADTRKGDQAACKKSWQKSGNVTAENRSEWLHCAAFAHWAVEEEGEWKAANLKKLPTLLKPYRAKLSKLAGKYTLVEAHFKFAGAAEEWAVYAARKDGDHVVLDAAVLAWKSTE